MLRISVVLLLVACATEGLREIGFETVDVNDKEVVELADYLTRNFNRQCPAKFHHKLLKIVRAKKEVAPKDLYNGYIIEFIFGMTTCKKQEVTYEEAKQCDVQEVEGAYKKCTEKVHKYMNGKHLILNFECGLASKKEI